jgi:flagellar export protein FliJ
MAFRFPLEAVLHFRWSTEHQQELRLRAANQRVARVRHRIEQLDRSGGELKLLQAKRLTEGTTAAEMRFALQCESEIVRRRREFEQQLAMLEQARDRQREIFQQARRARETLEAVRDRQLNLYRKKAGRREQRQVDDLFLLRLPSRREPWQGG